VFVLRKLYQDGVPGPGVLVAEGLFASAIGVGFAAWLFPAEASLVSVFLAAITAEDAIERLLEANRRKILVEGVPPIRANGRLAGRIFCLFAGLVFGFACAVLVLPEAQVLSIFSHQLGDFGGVAFPALHFGSFVDLFLNNLYVLCFFFVLAIPFRHDGLMIAIGWNASVWGSTFAALARTWSEQGGPPLPVAFARVMAACFVHMSAEALAFVLAGMAGVFVRKAVVKYSIESEVMESVQKTVLRLLGAALILVVLGAAWEAHVAPTLVSVLSR